MQLESYALVLLRRGPSAAGFTAEELEQLQDAHLGYLAAGRLAVEVMTWSTRAGSVTFRRA